MAAVWLGVAAALLALWFLLLLGSGRLRGLVGQTRVEIARVHGIQLALQLGIYVYWSLYWDEVSRRAPLIAAQIVFAYLFEMLLVWSRGRVWRVRLAPFPVVLSINLFLWFRDEVFFLQLLLVAGAYLGKEFLTWERDGRRPHVFNPSGLPLAVASAALMLTDSIGLTYGLDLIWSFYIPPHLIEWIFLLGLVVQCLFGTTPITLGTALTLWALHGLARLALGTSVAPHPFDPAVFLGMTLLVTDPVTSPRSASGKFLFGVAYGLGIFAAYVALRFLSQPSYFDKVLVVPIVNLMVPWCEQAGRRLATEAESLLSPSLMPGSRSTLAAHAAFFVALTPTLKNPRTDFEDPLPPARIGLTPPMDDLRIRAQTWRLAFPRVYAPFTFPEEWRRYRRLADYVPKSADEWIALGRVCLDYRREDDAVAALETAVGLAPQSAAAHRHLGHALMRRGRSEAAVRELTTSLEIEPDSVETLRFLGAALGMQRRYTEAIAHLERSLAESPDDFTTRFNLGGALLGDGRTEDAVDHLQRAVELRPANGAARVQLASALSTLGRLDAARTHLRRALLLMPANADARRLLAEIDRRSERAP